MDAVAFGRDGDRLLHRGAHSHAVDVGHRDRRDSGGLDVLLLALIDAAERDEHAVVAIDRAAQVLWKGICGQPERDRERHPVHIAGRRGLGVVAVAVRVHPDDSGPAPTAGDPSKRADGHRVIAAEDDRDVAGALDVGDDLREVLDDADDLVDVMRPTVHLRELVLVDLAEVLGRALVAVGDADVAAIPDRVAEVREAVAKTRVADRGRPHVDATAITAEVHRNADDLDRLLHVFVFGWKMARMMPSAASSSPTIVRTATRAKPRRIFSTVASNRAVSPGLTMRLKRMFSMPAKSPSPSRKSG